MEPKETIVERLRRIYGDIEPTLPATDSSPAGSYGALGDVDCPICHGIGFVSYDRPVGDPDFGRIVPCSCRRRLTEGERRSALLSRSNLRGYEEMTFERFNPDGRGQLSPEERQTLTLAKNAAMNFASRREGWLLFSGAYGTGKTHLAAAIANQAAADGIDVVFQPVPDLLDWLRASYSAYSDSYQERFDRIRTVPVLILDDLGAESGTEWAGEKIFQILNYRTVNQLATVITTNAGLSELDGRIASRLSDPALVTQIRITVPDYRKPYSNGGAFDSISTLHQLSDRLFSNFDGREAENLGPDARAELDQALRKARAFAASPQGWLIFSGAHGAGKTHLAAAIGNEAVGTNPGRVLFVSVPELLDHLRATFSPTSSVSFDRLFESVKNAPILILDHLNTANATPWTKEKLFQIVNYRSLMRLPTVVTTILPLQDLEPGIQSRFLDPKRSVIVSMFRIPMYGRSAESGPLPPRVEKKKRF